MPKAIIVSNTSWYIYNFRRTLAEFLREKGWDVLLVGPTDPYAEKLQAMGFRWRPWEVERKTLGPLGEFAAMRTLTALYREEQPDIVHHHTIKPNLYGSVAAHRAGVSGIVNSITGLGYVFLGESAKVRLLRTAVKEMYRYAFRRENIRVIFENRDDQNYLTRTRLVPYTRTRLIESVGVDPQRFAPRPTPSLTDMPPVILLASRMLWDKGVGTLVDAARTLKQHHSVTVVLAGSPDPGNPASISEAQLNAWQTEGVIEWWGFCADMPATYNRADIVTLPSMYAEGIPTTLLEAAACGKPVVTTNVPGCRDFVVDGKTGFVIQAGDAQALTHALEKLIMDANLRTSMGKAGRERVLSGYTTEQVNAATLRVYQELL